MNKKTNWLPSSIAAVALLAIALFSILTAEEPPIAITDIDWTNNKESTDFVFSAKNNTHDKMEAQILAKSHYISPSGYDSSYRHIKSEMISIELEPYEEKSFSKRISYSKELGGSNPRIELSISGIRKI